MSVFTLVCFGIMLEYLFGKIERFLTENHCNLFKNRINQSINQTKKLKLKSLLTLKLINTLILNLYKLKNKLEKDSLGD